MHSEWCTLGAWRRDSDEYKRWKASQEASASGLEGAAADLTLKDKKGNEIEKQLPGGKVKKKTKPQVQQLSHATTRRMFCSKSACWCRMTLRQLLAPSLRQIIIDKNTRNKRKCVTTIFGLEGFGVKLGEAAKLFGKKFASGAAVVKSPTEKEQIDIQGDCMDKVITVQA